MTTPDKEEMPTDRTAGPWTAKGCNIIGPDGLSLAVCWYTDGETFGIATANAQFIVIACNAYEPMREALILAEKADRIHSKCQECEDGAQAPEACGDCFPSADDARVARRNVLKSLGVRMRDVDRARAIKAEPSICNCSQEDVHDYGPCGEDCRSLVVSTLPVNDRHHSGSDNERNFENVRDAWKIIWEREAEIARLSRSLSELEAHHVEQNRLKRRSEADSKTLRIIRAALYGTDRQTSDDVGRLRALLVALDALIEQCRPLIAVDAFVLRDAIYEAHQARAALKGAAPQCPSHPATRSDGTGPEVVAADQHAAANTPARPQPASEAGKPSSEVE